MLQPKKHQVPQAVQGPHFHGAAKGGTNLDFGQYGLKAMEPERVTARQIEAARRAITRHMKRAGRVWIRVFPDVPVSSKPDRSPHGQGQGRAGILGVPGEAGPHHVRDRRRARSIWHGRR